ncbi:MAG: TonB-dependent receptor [Salinivirgaceae bacterium]|nr:TonB-dependent receptor [Salinivirgaceae bacterium]
MSKKLLLILLFFISTPFIITAQVFNIKGSVTDEQKNPLPGVTIHIKGTTEGAITDFDGNFTMNVPKDGVLIFSMVGMESKELPILNQNPVIVILAEDVTQLGEVVVIGYGTMKSKDLTSPIVSIKGDELSKQVASNPMQALQGKVAGVQIINSGKPGGESTVKIRGVGSIGDYAKPLYVVDGVFVDNIDFLSSNDIESLTVLKDASSAAIYGVRAANGVILVTTKKGYSEVPIINYSGYVGLQVPVNIMPMATKDQYIELYNKANTNTTGFVPKDPNAYPASTDWYKELVRTAITNSHNLDVSGASEKTSYSFGVNYYFQEGIMDAKNDYERVNLRARIDQKINDRIKVGFNTVYSNYNKQIPNDGSAFFSAYVNPPVYSIYDETNTEAYPIKFGAPQTYGYGNQYGNPVAAAYYYDNIEKGYKFLLNGSIELNLIEDKLSFKTSYNQDLNNWDNRNYMPEFYVGGSQGVRKSSLTKSFGNSSNTIFDNLLTFHDQNGSHSYTFLLGQSTRVQRLSKLFGSAIDVPGFDDASKYLSTGSYKDRNAWDGGDDFPYLYHGLSYFGRATYNYSDKYLASFTFRADGSSKYQEKWGYFPSLGLGWVLTKEDFLQNASMLQFLKLRGSWGLLGNDNIPSNSAVTLGTSGAESSGIFGDQLVDGVGAQTVIQNYLQWEVVDEFDFGIDFVMLHNKLSGGLDYYRRVTHNVVFKAPIATGGGVADLLANNGDVLNTGIELNLNWNDKINNDWSYHTGMNLTTIHNEVLALEGREYIPSGFVRGNYTKRTQVGQPIGSFYGYEIDGVYASESEALQDPVSQTIKDKGFFKYKDQNGDNVIDDKDKVFLGSSTPWLIAGIDFGMEYKQFDFSLSLQGQLGNKILNAKRMNRDIFVDGNYDQDFYDNYWTKDNKSDTYPSAEAYNSSFTQQANDFFVEDGSYIRIQNVQIGYTTKNIKYIQSLRLYASAQRPFTLFSYNGFTPEIGGSPIESGIDNSVYPMQAIYTIGMKLTF